MKNIKIRSNYFAAIFVPFVSSHSLGAMAIETIQRDEQVAERYARCAAVTVLFIPVLKSLGHDKESQNGMELVSNAFLKFSTAFSDEAYAKDIVSNEAAKINAMQDEDMVKAISYISANTTPCIKAFKSELVPLVKKFP